MLTEIFKDVAGVIRKQICLPKVSKGHNSLIFGGGHILCEIMYTGNGDRQRLITEKEVYMAIIDEVQEMHGDYGIAAIRKMPALQVKYLNHETSIVMILVKRGVHKLVQSAMVFVKKIGREEAFFRTLHLGGTIRSCSKFLVNYHKTQLPLLLQKCSTQKEREKVQKAIIASCQECKRKLQMMQQST